MKDLSTILYLFSRLSRKVDNLYLNKNQTDNPTEYSSQPSNILRDIHAPDVIFKRHRFRSSEPTKTPTGVRIQGSILSVAELM